MGFILGRRGLATIAQVYNNHAKMELSQHKPSTHANVLVLVGKEAKSENARGRERDGVGSISQLGVGRFENTTTSTL
jgi:hypothetical protein